MFHSRTRDIIRSPEDAATFRRWRRAVCLFYAAFIVVLAAVSGTLQFIKPEARIARSSGFAPPVGNAALSLPP